jgi:hypothetical protein
MNFPQSTLHEITDSEALMVRTAADRFGNYFLNAWACSVLLSKCVTSVDHSRLNFARYHAVLKKHHTLAVLSLVRLHKVQAMMDLRQALEAGCAAAFAIANPENEHFFKVDEHNIVTSPQNLTDKRYRWLDQNFRQRSDVIKAKKKLINEHQAHPNVVSADRVFRIDDTGELINAPFFDIEDVHLVKIDLWLAASIALELMDWFYGVNTGRDVIAFAPNFVNGVQQLAKGTNALQAELMATDRFQRIMAKMDARNAI